MPPKRTYLQTPNPVKLQMLDDDHENTHENQVIGEDEVIVALPSTAPSAAPFYPASPVRDATAQVPMSPPSPPTNRLRFLAGVLPVRVCCYLDLVKSTDLMGERRPFGGKEVLWGISNNCCMVSALSGLRKLFLQCVALLPICLIVLRPIAICRLCPSLPRSS
jgi:hypothetical protein